MNCTRVILSSHVSDVYFAVFLGKSKVTLSDALLSLDENVFCNFLYFI